MPNRRNSEACARTCAVHSARPRCSFPSRLDWRTGERWADSWVPQNQLTPDLRQEARRLWERRERAEREARGDAVERVQKDEAVQQVGGKEAEARRHGDGEG